MKNLLNVKSSEFVDFLAKLHTSNAYSNKSTTDKVTGADGPAYVSMTDVFYVVFFTSRYQFSDSEEIANLFTNLCE